ACLQKVDKDSPERAERHPAPRPPPVPAPLFRVPRAWCKGAGPALLLRSDLPPASQGSGPSWVPERSWPCVSHGECGLLVRECEAGFFAPGCCGRECRPGSALVGEAAASPPAK